MNMRESFEAWIQSRYPEYPLDVELGNCGRPDSYTWTVVHQMWQAWQASRAQPIALPTKIEFDQYVSTEQANTHNDLVDDFAQMLTAQGYAVKESQ